MFGRMLCRPAKIAKHRPGAFPMFAGDVAPDRKGHGGKHRSVVRKAQTNNEIWDHVGGNHEISKSPKKHDFYMTRSLRVRRTIIGRDGLIEKWHLAQRSPDLSPEASFNDLGIAVRAKFEAAIRGGHIMHIAHL